MEQRQERGDVFLLQCCILRIINQPVQVHSFLPAIFVLQRCHVAYFGVIMVFGLESVSGKQRPRALCTPHSTTRPGAGAGAHSEFEHAGQDDHLQCVFSACLALTAFLLTIQGRRSIVGDSFFLCFKDHRRTRPLHNPEAMKTSQVWMPYIFQFWDGY